MAALLFFTLYAPLAGFGDLAVGERRVGADRPTRSGILGLCAAALGLDRDAEAAQAALSAGLDVALRLDAEGRAMSDYHTVQSAEAPRRAKQPWPTRAAALAAGSVSTLISRRDYRTDLFVTVALHARTNAEPDLLPRVAAALARPVFILYVGRKACPLGLPLRPMMITADGLGPGIDQYDAARPVPEQRVRAALQLGEAVRYVADTGWDRDGLLAAQFQCERTEQRRDAARTGRGWQFDLREELVLSRRQPEGQAA